MYTRPYCACIRVLIARVYASSFAHVYASLLRVYTRPYCARIRVFICSCIRVLIARVYASLLRVYTRPYCARIRVFICSCIRVLIARVYASLLRAYTRLHLLVYTRPYCACIRVQKSRIHAFKMISEEIYARSKPMYNRTNFETNGLPYSPAGSRAIGDKIPGCQPTSNVLIGWFVSLRGPRK